MRTKYEIAVEKGEISEMNGLDQLLITAFCEDVLKGGELENDPANLEDLKMCWIEIEYIFHDYPEKLEKLKKILNIKM